MRRQPVLGPLFGVALLAMIAGCGDGSREVGTDVATTSSTTITSVSSTTSTTASSTTTSTTTAPASTTVVAPPTTSLDDGTYVMPWGSYESDPLTIVLGAEEHAVRFVPGRMFHTEEADAAVMEDGYTTEPNQLPNPYYIRDLGIGPVVLPVSADVTPVAYEWPYRFFETSWDEFAALYDGDPPHVPSTGTLEWWPVEVVVVDGRVVELRQFYLP